MKKEKESWTLLWVWTAYLPVKEIKWEFYVKVSDFTRCINELEQEKENIKVASLEWEIKWLNYTIEKLKEENQTLELWLDNKEKLNEEYRKEIDKYKRQYEHSMWEDDELIYEEWLYD